MGWVRMEAGQGESLLSVLVLRIWLGNSCQIRQAGYYFVRLVSFMIG